jgi:hypothetical protein
MQARPAFCFPRDVKRAIVEGVENPIAEQKWQIERFSGLYIFQV